MSAPPNPPVRRGDVLLVNFPFSGGGGGKPRPVVVVQADALNARRSNLILAAVTTNLRRVGHATQFLVTAASPEGRAAGLTRDSAVTCEDLFTLDRSRTIRPLGRLSPTLIAQLDACLKAALGLP